MHDIQYEEQGTGPVTPSSLHGKGKGYIWQTKTPMMSFNEQNQISQRKEKAMNEIPASEVMTTLNDSEFLKYTNYWETSWNKNGIFFLLHNEGAFRLLVPDIHREKVSEMKSGKAVIMGYGYHRKLKKRVVTLVFDDMTEYPFSMTLSPEVCFGPLSECSFGPISRNLHVYVNPCKLELTLPCVHTGIELPCYKAA